MSGFSLQVRPCFDPRAWLHASAEPLSGLRRALPAMAEFFAVRHATVARLPLESGKPELIETLNGGEIEGPLRHYRRLMAEGDDLRWVREGGFAPVGWLGEEVTSSEFEGSALFREVFYPAGWRDRLGFAVRVPGATLAVLFHRPRIFGAGEVARAEEVQRCVAELVDRDGCWSERDRFRHGWRLLLGEGDRVGRLPGSVENLLRLYFGPMEAGNLPPFLAAWVRAARRKRDHGAWIGNAGALVVNRPRGRLHVRLMPGEVGRTDVLCLCEERGRHDFYRLRELRLTERECAVLFWVAQGKADADVAVILGMACKTVGKHVENILLKLGANNRTAAAVLAVDWLAEQADERAFRGSDRC